MLRGKPLHGFLLQGEELLLVVEVAGFAFGKEVGGDGAGVLLQREYGHRHGGAVVQKMGPDRGGGEVLVAALDLRKDAALRIDVRRASALPPAKG